MADHEFEPPEASAEPDREREVEAIADRYLAQLQRGEAPDRDAILAAHPEIAEILDDHLALVEAMHGARPLEGEVVRGALAGAARPEQPVASDRAADPGEPRELPSRIGRYEILEELGEGGMGVVYLAEQTEPIRRRVALKLVKLGMDTRDVLARFESERQALAMMDHPGIARVFEAGATEQGRPYFAMEYVRGVPITDYCDTVRMTTADRLGLFNQVCRAVQHAHQKGVVHRDLKPSNILITIVDGVPSPKIIDFGVAKATNQRLTERSLYTEHGRIIGTPEYMSPEQAEMSPLDVDTRTDIYSLGVVLYELLIGVLPLDAYELRTAGYDEIRRKIREQEPSRPSTRVSTLGKDCADLAARRRTDPTALARGLRGDLDWIAMKTLDKDRTRRYATASELAADIERHLSHEPVLAGPPGAGYRMRKFFRRHRAPVLSALAVSLSLLVGLAVAFALFLRADAARQVAEEARQAEAAQREEAIRARTEALAQKEAAERAQADEEAQRERAEREREKSEAISAFLQGMLASVDPEKEGRQVRVAEVLDHAATGIEARWDDVPEVEAKIRSTIGTTYLSLGLLEEAETHIREALEIRRRIRGNEHPATLASMNDLAGLLRDRGEWDEAETLLRETLETRRRVLGAEHPETLASANDLAGLMVDRGSWDEAETLLRETLETRRRVLGGDHPDTLASTNGLARLLRDRGEWDEAETLLRGTLETRRRVLGGEHPDTLGSASDLAGMLRERAKWEEAETLLRETLRIKRRVLGPDHPDTLASMSDLAEVLLARGTLEEAEILSRQTLEIRRRVLGDEHPHTVASMSTLAGMLHARGALDEAEVLSRRTLDIRRRVLGDDHPFTLASIHDLAMILRDQGEREGAETLFREALEMRLQILGDEHPDTLLTANDLAGVLRDRRRWDAAEALYRRTMESQRRCFGDEHPDSLASMGNLADVLQHLGQVEEAESILRKLTVARRRTLGGDHPETLESMRHLGRALQDLGRLEEAESILRKTLETRRRTLREEHPDRLASTGDLAGVLLEMGRLEEAETLFRQTLDARRRSLGEGHPDTLLCLNNLAMTLARQGKIERAEELAKRSVTAALRAIPASDWQRGRIQVGYGRILIEGKRYRAAERHLLEGFRGLRETLGVRHKRTEEAIEGLIDLYEAWKKPEQAEAYRSLLAPEE